MSPGFAVGRFDDRVEIVVTGAWSDDAAEAIRANNADRLVLNYALGFGEPSLDFIRDLPIRQLVLLDPRLPDLGPVYDLAPTLELLHVTTDPALTIDISRLSRLTDLAADWAQVSCTIEAGARIRRASLRSYAEGDLSPLEALRDLEYLSMKDWPRLQTLAGLSNFVNIKWLRIYRARNLDSIGDLRTASRLEELELVGCRRLSEVVDLTDCLSLRRLNLSDGGNLRTLQPLRKLVNLETLYLFGTTKVVDGDLRPIADLPRLQNLRMRNRRHYRPSVAQIKESLPR